MELVELVKKQVLWDVRDVTREIVVLTVSVDKQQIEKGRDNQIETVLGQHLIQFIDGPNTK